MPHVLVAHPGGVEEFPKSQHSNSPAPQAQRKGRQAFPEAQVQVYRAPPDLNAIEGWWRRLKDALVESAPPHLESRKDFLKRLRSTVNRLNRIACDDGLRLCTNQRARR